jgi:ketosteroid isomerase-like protein
MSRENVEGHPPLEAFRQAYLAANEAFNRHDFEAAFFGFHPELEWHTVAEVPGSKLLYGRRGVIQAFRELLDEFPDWRVEPQEFIEGGENAILVRNIAMATGREGGVPIRQPFTQVWSFSDGRPIRVREYFDHTEALEAVGLSE